MKKLFLLLFMCCVVFGANAESSKTINFDGQNADSFELDLVKQVLRYRTEEYDDTCTRQVPDGTRNVCRDVTRYRRQCHEQPGRNDCRTVYDQVCRNETRYRRQCTNGPSRQQCSTSPSRQVCSNGPARRECRTVPQQVCRTVNGQRQCTTSGTRQQCRNVPGPRTCRTEPGQRTCRTVQGPQTCRDVPYTDRVCANVPRQSCTWIPSRQVCNDVPYQDRVCSDEVVYRTETYACTRTREVPYQADRENKADVQVSYSDLNVDSSRAELSFLLDKAGNVDLKVKENSTNPSLVYVSKKQEIENSDDNLSTDTRFNISFVARDAYLAPLKEEVQVSSADSLHLVLKTAKVVKKDDLSIKIKINKKGVFGIGSYKFEKTLAPGQYTTAKTLDNSFLDIDFKAIGAEVKEGKKYEFELTLILKPSSDLVTPVDAELSKTVKFKKKL